ncbi:MAG: GAF domain-containing protein, partial [Bacillales bacterium]|nr:GAF domain-containing protein [Bacillales bacterium]
MKTGQKLILPIITILFASFTVISVATTIFAKSSTEKLIDNQMSDTVNLVKTPIDLNISLVETMISEIENKNLSLCRAFAGMVAEKQDDAIFTLEWMLDYANEINIDELYISDGDGITIASNNPNALHSDYHDAFDFNSSEQSRAFLPFLNPENKGYLIQEPQPRGLDGALFQYIGVARQDKPGIIQVGISVNTINKLLRALSLDTFVDDFLVGKKGGILVFDKEGILVGDSGSSSSYTFDVNAVYQKANSVDNAKIFINFGSLYLLVANYREYKIICFIPTSEMVSLYLPQIIISIIVGITCIVASALLIFDRVKKILLNPAQQLAYEALNLKQGMVLDEERYKNNNEFATLSSSLNSMIKTLDLSQQTINTLNAMEKDLKEKLNLEGLITSISKRFITPDDIEIKIKEVLKETGEFLNVSRILLSSINEENEEGLIDYFWLKEEEFQPKEKDERTGGFIKNTFPLNFNKEVDESIVSCDDVLENEKFSLFYDLGVKAIMLAPIYVNKMLWGVLSIEECQVKRVWEENEKQFLFLLNSIFTS